MFDVLNHCATTLFNSENKDSLNQFLARQFIQLHAGKSQIIVVNFNETILSNDELLLSEEDISNCTPEEADPRLIRRSINQAKNGFEDINKRTVDYDVFILTLVYSYYMVDYGAKQVFLYLATNTGTDEYDIIKLSRNIGKSNCIALPFFHSFTGCDTSSSFFGKGKFKFWEVWISGKIPLLTETFIELRNCPANITENHAILN